MAKIITEQVMDEIRARVDIVELIGSRIKLKKAGSSFKGCCPFHQEKTPSFHVNPTKQFFHCFGCGVNGDVFTFLMKQDGLTFVDAVTTLAERTGVKIDERHDTRSKSRKRILHLHAELAAFYHQCLLESNEAELARRYLAERKLSAEIIAKFGLGYAMDSGTQTLLQWAEKHKFTPEELVSAGVLAPSRSRHYDYYDRFAGRLMFPISDRRGRVIAFSGRILQGGARLAKYVNSPETEIFIKGSVLYALDQAAPNIVKNLRREAIVCEGQIDVIRCHAMGFNRAVATQGTAITREHVRELKRFADSVVLVFDGDSAGRKAAVKAGEIFLSEDIPVRAVLLDQGEDPDSILVQRPVKEFNSMLEEAESIVAFQIRDLQGTESNPDAIDALKRIADSVFVTIGECSSAMMRARLLQEAADLLHLPFSVIESDFERYLDKKQQQALYAAQAATIQRKVATSTPLPPVARRAVSEEVPQGVHHTMQLPVAERHLCELLIEYEGDQELLDMVAELLPLWMIKHSVARTLINAFLEQRTSDDDLLIKVLSDADPHTKSLLETLLTHKRKLIGAKEMTKEDVMQDLLKRMWSVHLKDKRDMLAERSTPENDMNRLLLTTVIKQVETAPWNTVREIILTEIQKTP